MDDRDSAFVVMVPPLTWEERAWGVRADPGEASRRARRAHAGPYDAAIPPPIAGIDVALPGGLAAELDDATGEAVRFDQEVGSRLAPYRALLLRSESAASSRIENLTASAAAVASAEIGERAGRNARSIVANTASMREAVEHETLDATAILDMHATLLGDEHPEWVGRWREQQVWIGGSHLGPHRAAFVPPHHDRVPAAMDDLLAFVDRDDLPVLAQSAIAHAQFETVHPFPDGNGRVGRALVHAMLRSKEVVRTSTVPVSAGLLADVDAYFGALGAYRRGDAGPIISMFADATFRATSNGRQLVADLDAVRTSWEERLTARRDATAWRLLDDLLAQPVTTASGVARRLDVSRQAATSALAQLLEADVVRQLGQASRGRRWVAHEVTDALDAFAARAGRRQVPPR